MSIKIEGLDELVNALEKAASKVPNAKQQFLAKEAGLIRGRAMKNTPADTGLLRSSWKQTPVSSNSVTIYNNTEYSAYVEYGHRVKIHGKFTGKVVAGRHMLKKGIEETQSQFAQDTKAILRTIFEG